MVIMNRKATNPSGKRSWLVHSLVISAKFDDEVRAQNIHAKRITNANQFNGKHFKLRVCRLRPLAKRKW